MEFFPMMYNLPRFLLILFIHGAKTMIHEFRGALRGPWAHLPVGFFQPDFSNGHVDCIDEI